MGQVTQGATETALHGPQAESRPGVQTAQAPEEPHLSGGQLKELISRSSRTLVSGPGRVCVFILSKWRLKALGKGVMLVT